MTRKKYWLREYIPSPSWAAKEDNVVDSILLSTQENTWWEAAAAT